MSDITELYQEIILDHNKNPRNFHKPEMSNRKAEGFNPLCGDKYIVYLKLKDDSIAEIGFEGSGCAISKASVSVMSEVVKGKNKEEAEILIDKFHQLLTGTSDPEREYEKIGKIAVFAGVRDYPVRIKCATLAWHTLRAALEKKSEIVTTE